MKHTSSSSVIVLSLMIALTTVGLIVFSALTSQSETVYLPSHASEDASPKTATAEETCSLRAHVFINELTETGDEVPLTFSTSDTDPLLWGFADTINLPPYTESIIPFNAADIASYTIDSQELSFALAPESHQVYPSEQIISVTTLIDDTQYEIVRRDINTCSTADNDIWRCGRQTPDTDVHTITDISLMCNMDLEFGWVVQKRTEPFAPITQLSHTNTLPFMTSDINGDGTVSAIDLTIVIESHGQTDPLADVNKDGKVNVIDYQLVADAIRDQV